MFCYSPLLTWIVLGAIPFYVGLSLPLTPILRGGSTRISRAAPRTSRSSSKRHRRRDLKAMAVEPQMQRRWEEQLAAYVRASFRRRTW